MSKVDPVHWFLKDKDDVRSSYHLEDVGTEFLVQGLELDQPAFLTTVRSEGVETPLWRAPRTEDGRWRSRHYVKPGRGSSARHNGWISVRSRRVVRNAG